MSTTSVALRVGHTQYALPPSSALVDFLDGMATDYRDASHTRMADAKRAYDDRNEIQRAAELAAEAAHLQRLANDIEAARDAVEENLEATS